MTCQNCKANAAADAPFCSLACASERYALIMNMLEGICDDVRVVEKQLAAAAVSLNRVTRLL